MEIKPTTTAPAATAPVAPAEDTKTVSKVAVFKNRQPCHWEITPGDEEDTITAFNSVSNESFSGTMEEFNAALRA